MSGRTGGTAGGLAWKRAIALILAFAVPAARLRGRWPMRLEKAGGELSAQQAEQGSRGRAGF